MFHLTCRSSSRSRYRRGRGVRLALLVLAAAIGCDGSRSAGAQEVRDTVSGGAAPEAAALEGAESQAPRLEPRAMAVAGVRGLSGEGIHGYGGLEGGFLYGRWGFRVLGQYGMGNGFRSVALGAGPALRVVEVERASLSVYGGVGRYGEREESSGLHRDMTTLFGGAGLRVPVGFGALGLTLSVWHGSVEEEGFREAVRHTPYRLSLGLGI